MATTSAEKTGRYCGASFALLTKHGKERAIGPRFREALDAGLVVVDSFDTDTLGTFTRDVSRFGSQLDAARRKAELAAELSGCPLGLGSEGSFAPGPLGLVSLNLEVLTLVDRERGLEITGAVRLPGHHASGVFDSWAALEAFAREMKFPSHGLVLRPDRADDPRFEKDIADWEMLAAAYERCLACSHGAMVFVESDLRAHRNPTRMEHIGAACADLLERMLSTCPSCESPGFGMARYESGLPCSWCGEATNDWKAREFRCVACPHTESRAREDLSSADPTHCPFCNP